MKTITITTSDYGPVTIPEPDWCAGRMHRPLTPPPPRAEIAHQSDPVQVTVPTARGDAVLLHLALWQDVFPKAAWENGDRVHAVASLVDSDSVAFDVAALDQFADAMHGAARQIHEFANRLALQQPRGGEAR